MRSIPGHADKSKRTIPLGSFCLHVLDTMGARDFSFRPTVQLSSQRYLTLLNFATAIGYLPYSLIKENSLKYHLLGLFLVLRYALITIWQYSLHSFYLSWLDFLNSNHSSYLKIYSYYYLFYY